MEYASAGLGMKAARPKNAMAISSFCKTNKTLERLKRRERVEKIDREENPRKTLYQESLCNKNPRKQKPRERREEGRERER